MKRILEKILYLVLMIFQFIFLAMAFVHRLEDNFERSTYSLVLVLVIQVFANEYEKRKK